MKTILATITLAFISLNPTFAMAGDASVYFITGAPIEGPHGISIKILTDFMAQTHADVKFTVIHNSHWRKVCDEIKADKKTNPNEKVILAGHSYGGQASITISHCLQQAGLGVDMIIPLDPVQKPFEPNVGVVPDNVNIAYSFYQKQDLAIRGNDHLHRADGSDTHVANTLVKTPGRIAAHHNMVDVLVRGGVVQGLISEGLQ